jgi:hypothetical protein
MRGNTTQRVAMDDSVYSESAPLAGRDTSQPCHFVITVPLP